VNLSSSPVSSLSLQIAIAQINPVVGAFEQNLGKIKEAYERACSLQARLLLTPELGICGYPPHDLVDRPEMFERNEKALEELTRLTAGKKCALLVGHIARNPSHVGRSAQNVVSVLENGKEVFRQAKTLLPTYDVLDEARYFEPASEVRLWSCDGHRIGVAICEDLWANDPLFGRRLYGKNPVDTYRDLDASLILSLSASPYEWGKRLRREKIHQEIARSLQVPLVYINQMGATDEILFDGGSFVLNAEGQLAGHLPFFETAFGIVKIQSPQSCTLEALAQASDSKQVEAQVAEVPTSEMDILARGLVVGIREYFQRTKFKTAVIGLSGGIDSAVVAALAVKALGPKNLLGVGMPSQYSSSHSLSDAELLARNLGIPFEVRPIKFMFSTASRELSENRGQLAPLAQENLQSRLRGLILMTLSNHYSALVLTTGNKSELAMGYGTLYGDMVGALAPIGDLFKTRVYELARYINQEWGSLIPENTITKAPSAELKPGQVDQDSLPPYEVLDEILTAYLENGMRAVDLEAQFQGQFDQSKYGNIRDILKRLEINEFKRRQAAPVLKISPKAFGVGRRLPIAKTWE
jgi:NAD+ synthetase